jgi:hypothetical protein
MAQTTFSPQHKAALTAAGLTDQHVQQLAAAGCDPAKAAAAVPQIKAKVEAAGIDWGKWFQLFMEIAPIILGFLTPQPAPATPTNPPMPPTPPGPEPAFHSPKK